MGDDDDINNNNSINFLNKHTSIMQINSSTISAIFGNIEAVLEFHEKFLFKLKQLSQKWPFVEDVGKQFIDMVGLPVVLLLLLSLLLLLLLSWFVVVVFLLNDNFDR